jgi:hypothetical protein
MSDRQGGPAPLMSCSGGAESFECAWSPYLNSRTPYQSFHADYHVLLFFRTSASALSSMRLGSQASGGILCRASSFHHCESTSLLLNSLKNASLSFAVRHLQQLASNDGATKSAAKTPQHSVRQHSVTKEIKYMPDWLWFIAFFVAYIVLMRWVLPHLGVRT